MSGTVSQIISYLRLIVFYKGLFPPGRLLKGAFEIAVKGRTSFPVTIDLLVTERCNFSCRMCYLSCSPEDPNRSRENELSIGEIAGLAEEAAPYRPLICLGGGEPLLREDLPEIIAEIKQRGLKCMVYTNGYLLDAKKAEKMLDLRLDALMVSLYGWGHSHDRITGVKGSFERTMGNLKHVLDKRGPGTRVLISSLPLPENLEDLPRMADSLKDIGADGLKIEQLSYLTHKESGDKPLPGDPLYRKRRTFTREGYFDEAYIRRLIGTYREISRKYPGFVHIKPYLTEEQLIKWYSGVPKRNKRCYFLAHSTFIGPGGEVIPCQYFPECRIGNIRENRLTRIWRSTEYDSLRKSIGKDRPVVCSRCCKN